MKQQLLLLDDVDGLGRSGDLVAAKPGYIRNFLLPQKKAVVADKRTLKLQERLKEERTKRAAIDKKEAEELANKLINLVLSVEVKVDPEGHMYGSVTPLDIVNLMEQKGYILERKNILIGQPIRAIGKHSIHLRLKENVPAMIELEISPEGGPLPVKEETPPAV